MYESYLLPELERLILDELPENEKIHTGLVCRRWREYKIWYTRKFIKRAFKKCITTAEVESYINSERLPLFFLSDNGDDVPEEYGDGSNIPRDVDVHTLSMSLYYPCSCMMYRIIWTHLYQLMGDKSEKYVATSVRYTESVVEDVGCVARELTEKLDRDGIDTLDLRTTNKIHIKRLGRYENNYDDGSGYQWFDDTMRLGMAILNQEIRLEALMRVEDTYKIIENMIDVYIYCIRSGYIKPNE